jgi:broad specificity phosphatase PhoE
MITIRERGVLRMVPRAGSRRRAFLAASATVVALVAVAWPGPATAQELIVLVRHAEQTDHSLADPPLSAAGEARASALAGLLADAGITAIYASERQRTQATAAPLAERLSAEVWVVPARESEQLLRRIREEHPSGRVLVVGHSNTLPALLRLLGHPYEGDLGQDDFDNVFVVRPAGEAGSAPTVLRLRVAGPC